MPVCYCDKCNGRLVSWQVRSNHQRKLLKNQSILQQNAHKRPIESSSISLIAGTSSLSVPVYLPDTLEPPVALDLDDCVDSAVNHEALNHDPVFATPDMRHGYFADHIPTPTDLENGVDDQEVLHEDDLVDTHTNELEDTPAFVVSNPSEDSPDPFAVEHHDTQPALNIREIPEHLLVIYAFVSWLHLQFMLPRVACQALLAFLARLLTFLDPRVTPPFVTLQSVRRTLGIDSHIEFLAVCPSCRDVYPSATSKYVQDVCTTCNVPIFSSDQTKRGNRRGNKTPLIKYPYLSLSDQLTSILTVPGVEGLLDEWRTKPRKEGEYRDIFDGEMCRLKLKAPDGGLFFSNLPHETIGPRGELRIGVNLGVDWYVQLTA